MRPLCRKCIDSGRECGGYQRDLVFITATVEDGGRCSSHPRRTITPGSSSNKKSRSPESEDGRPKQPDPPQPLQLVALQPLTPAWHDQIRLLNRGGAEYLVQFVGLHMHLQSVVLNEGGDGAGQFKLLVPQYSTPEFHMPMVEEEFDTPSRCLVHLPTAQGDGGPSGSLCVFLYEVCNKFLH